MTKTLLAVVGPTGIGKTALGIQLARHFDTEIISADSRQFFKEMHIGTAVPNPDELAAARHHFIQHISIEDEYNVGQFEQEALAKLKELFETKDTAILVGGSGLYVDALQKGLDDFPKVDPNVRRDLKNTLSQEGITVLQEQLKTLDYEHYQKIDLNNPQRLLRALEICLGTGKPYSSFTSKKKVQRPFETIKIGLYASRERIYKRINQRVDQMLETGLLKEARSLYAKKHLNALQTVGYKELFAHFEGAYDLETAVAEIKKNTRRFAKRQLTWYRKDNSIIWFDYQTPLAEIIKEVIRKVS